MASKRVGSYDLIEQLGQGPHGQVYLAVDTVRDRMVTVKMFKSLDPLIRTERGLVFQRRVEALSRVESEWFGTIFSASPAGETPCLLTREYVNGITLASLRHHCPTLPIPFATALLHGVARALAAVHAVDLVHGNLKLNNVLVQQAGGVKVVDPALAAPLLAASVTSMNLTSGMFGSPVFMAPEQLSDGHVTAATDAYSFGVLAYLLYCGRYPFEEPELGRLRRMKLNGEYPPARSLVPDLPPELDKIVRDCLFRAPTQRNASLENIADRLRDWLHSVSKTPGQALVEGVQSVSFVFMVSSIGSAPRPVEPMPAPVAMPSMPSMADSPVKRQTSGVRHPQVAAPAAMAASRMAANAATRVVTPEEIAAAGEGPPDTTGPTPVRLSDTQQELMPSVLFGVGEPIPVAPAAPESSGDMGAGKGYLLAAAVIVAAAVIWGMVREQPPVAQPPGPSAPDVVRRLNPDVLLERAHTDRDKSPELALVSARAAANAWPNSGTAQLLLARALSRSGDYPAAQKVLEKAEKLLPESLEPGRLLVELLLKRGSASAAVAAARRALLTHSTDGTMHLLLARGLLAERHPDEALKSLATATLLDPDNAEAQRLLGRARAARGEHAPARDAFGAAIKLDPQDASAYVGLSRSLLALGRGGEATDLLRRGLVIAPDSEELHYAVGRVLLQDGRYDEAATQLARVVSRFPDGWRAWFALGLAELHRGRNAEAVQALEKAASRRNQAEILHDLGLALSRLGMRGKAVEAFGEAIQLKYDLWQSHCERARVYFRLERYQDATRGWRETQKLNPRCAVAAAMLEAPHGTALAHLQLGLPCAPQDALDLPD